MGKKTNNTNKGKKEVKELQPVTRTIKINLHKQLHGEKFKKKAPKAVGAFFAFKVIFDANKGFKFEKVFAKSFAEQTGSIYYDEESLVLSIGLASGLIVFYKIMSDSMFTQYDFMCEHQHHRGMVTGVAYDSKTGFMYSCGADKKLVVAETNYLDVPTEVYESLTEYTKLVLDRKNDRLFLTNEAGEVDIFVTSVFPPNLANTVVTSSDGPITGIAMDYKNCHMFTCSDSGPHAGDVLRKTGNGKSVAKQELTGQDCLTGCPPAC